MMDFVNEYYIWIITIGLFLIFALIGFLVDNVKHKKEKESQILNQQGELTEDEKKMLENVDALTTENQAELTENVNQPVQPATDNVNAPVVETAPVQTEPVEAINENGNK